MDGLLAVALLAVLGPLSLPPVWDAAWPSPARAAVIVLVLIGHLSVAARRVLPVVAYTVCCVEMLTLVIAPDITTAAASEFAGQPVPPILLPSALVFPVLLYAVAAYSARPWPLVALLVGLVGAALTTVRLWTLDGLAGQAAQGGIGWRLFVLAALVAAVLAPLGLGRFSGVVVLTTFDLAEHAFAALRAGASGFLLKDASAEDVVAAIRAVHAGDAVLVPSTTKRLIAQVAGDLPGPRTDPGPLDRLTEREREVLREVAAGASNAEIATRMLLSEATVKTHVGRLLGKLGLRDRVQLVVLAYESGFVRRGS